MDNSHVDEILTEARRTNFIGSAKRSILKFVKLQSLVAKCCEIRKINLATFANFVYICITRGDAYHFPANFGLNVVGSFVRNTIMHKISKLEEAIFSVFYSIS